MILVFHFLVLHFSIHKLTIRLFILYNKIILLLIYLLSFEVREGPKWYLKKIILVDNKWLLWDGPEKWATLYLEDIIITTSCF